MKITRNRVDSKTGGGDIEFTVTNAEDAYVFSNIIAEGDVVEASTTRKLSLDGGRSQQKITLKLAVKVERLEFDLVDGHIDLKGKVARENEHVRQGSYHTINISVGDSFKLFKTYWGRMELAQIKEAAKDKPGVCLVIFYDRECVVSTVSSVGVTNIYKGEIKNKNFKMVNTSVIKLKDTIKTFIIAGFSETRNEFIKQLLKEQPALEKQVMSVKLSSVYKGMPSSKVINKIMLDKEFSKEFAEVQYVDDLREMDEFLKLSATNNAQVCIGMDEIQEALDYGAVKSLFITNEMYRPRTVEERKEVESIIKQCRELRAKICVIPVQHEYGTRLKEMGHISCTILFNFKS